MPVSINITGENAEQAIQEFSVLSSHFVSQPNAPVTVPQQEEKPKRQSRQTAPKETAKPDPDPVQEEDEQEGEGETEGGSDEGPIPTDVDLRAAAQNIGKTPEGKAAIKALLNKYGVPNITGVPDGKRVAFLADLGAISDDDLPY